MARVFDGDNAAVPGCGVVLGDVDEKMEGKVSHVDLIL